VPQLPVRDSLTCRDSDSYDTAYRILRTGTVLYHNLLEYKGSSCRVGWFVDHGANFQFRSVFQFTVLGLYFAASLG
jgi:hypothetical protein